MTMLVPLAGYGAYSLGKGAGLWSGGGKRGGWAGRYPEVGPPPFRQQHRYPQGNDPLYHESGVQGSRLHSGKKKAGRSYPFVRGVAGYFSPAVGVAMDLGGSLFGSGGGAKKRRPRKRKGKKRKSHK